MYDRSIHPIVTPVNYFKSLMQDLRGRRAHVKANYRVLLDKDPDISGMYVETDVAIDTANSFSLLHVLKLAFLSPDFRCFRSKNMSRRLDNHFGTNDYHIAPKKDINKTIPHALRMNDLPSFLSYAQEKNLSMHNGKDSIKDYYTPFQNQSIKLLHH